MSIHEMYGYTLDGNRYIDHGNVVGDYMAPRGAIARTKRAEVARGRANERRTAHVNRDEAMTAESATYAAGLQSQRDRTRPHCRARRRTDHWRYTDLPRHVNPYPA